ncbi:MAG: hypothetical protein BA873_03750 [Desulfobulbaceae bacterium C00003063]|nr:MAG: hypothetical protein BA873_03750 [Desulfobulbaceae bacterium C00003063]
MSMIPLRIFRFFIMFVLLCWFFLLPILYAQETRLEGRETQDVVLTPADQLILDSINSLERKLNGRIDKINDRIDNLGRELNTRIDKIDDRIDNLGKELNTRIDKINDRIDNLWITMFGGFLGVMAFIGGIVFWDRRTFLKRAREECRDEVSVDRKKVEAMLKAMRKLSERFPEVREVLNSSGLL